MHRLHRVAVAAVLLVTGVGIGVQLAPRPAAEVQTVAQAAGTIRQASIPSGTLGGRIDYEIYLPAGYATSSARYPTIYLLHGRGDSMEAWTREKADLDRLIADRRHPADDRGDARRPVVRARRAGTSTRATAAATTPAGRSRRR